MFPTFDNLQQHLDAERHVFMEVQDTAYDIIGKKWASILSSVSLQKQGSVPPVKNVCDGTAAFVEAGRPIHECLESDDEEPICQDGNLKALQLLIANEL